MVRLYITPHAEIAHLDLSDMFGEIGEVESVRIITDRDTRRSKVLAFVAARRGRCRCREVSVGRTFSADQQSLWGPPPHSCPSCFEEIVLTRVQSGQENIRGLEVSF